MERRDLIAALSEAVAGHREVLDRTKEVAADWGAHPDWPWNGLVLSAATRGGSARWERDVAQRYETELSWTILDVTPDDDRRRRFETVGRFWRRTASWLEFVFQHIHHAGGPAAIREVLAPLTAEDVIAFWTALPEVGEKYARNIMMDTYDPRFRDGRFAIDSRIKSLLPILGYDGSNRYDSQEAFLDTLARELGVEGWELDRFLYQGHQQILTAFG